MENDERRQVLSVTTQRWVDTDPANTDLMYREGIEVIVWQTVPASWDPRNPDGQAPAGEEELVRRRFTSQVYVGGAAGRFKVDKPAEIAQWVADEVYEHLCIELAPEA